MHTIGGGRIEQGVVTDAEVGNVARTSSSRIVLRNLPAGAARFPDAEESPEG